MPFHCVTDTGCRPVSIHIKDSCADFPATKVGSHTLTFVPKGLGFWGNRSRSVLAQLVAQRTTTFSNPFFRSQLSAFSSLISTFRLSWSMLLFFNPNTIKFTKTTTNSILCLDLLNNLLKDFWLWAVKNYKYYYETSASKQGEYKFGWTNWNTCKNSYTLLIVNIFSVVHEDSKFVFCTFAFTISWVPNFMTCYNFNTVNLNSTNSTNMCTLLFQQQE